jgi:hypothetical protein
LRIRNTDRQIFHVSCSLSKRKRERVYFYSDGGAGSAVAGPEPEAEPGPAVGLDVAEEPRGMPIEVLPHTYRSVVNMNPINHR